MSPATAANIPALLLLMITVLHLHVPPAQPMAISFDYTSFSPNTKNITYIGGATAGAGAVDLTPNQLDTNTNYSVGRAFYSFPVHLWDNATGKLTNFTSRFSFMVQPVPGNRYKAGDGLAFFLTLNGSDIPANSSGGGLAIFDASNTSFPTVAVEFDTFPNSPGWDPPAVHVGIDVGNIWSVVYKNWTDINTQTDNTIHATVAYDAGATNLSVFFSSTLGTNRSLSRRIDLREVLPEWVYVGFSASTGFSSELHKILSWSFNSSLEASDHTGTGSNNINTKTGKSKIGLLAGVLAAVGALAAGSGLAWFIVWQRKTGRWRRRGAQEVGIDLAGIDDGEFDAERGPKKFAYQELARATKNFATEEKLGRGGFGDVYRGVLSDARTEVAVKRVARDSNQGMKEYVAEVKIISRLRHRNLVQLVGWCREEEELLLVYEYMPNGSLDAHLFGRGGKAVPLSWPTRYNIAKGVAAALLYLHEEWEQCVVHRDVKSSNVMLDANFNAKLGDFGLARLVDHGRGLQTTVLAGTMGYLAPECATTGKASTESDVYSFGVVALEIACGRRPIEPAAEEGQVGLVGWAWGLYGKHAVLEAADRRLSTDELDGPQMERLMVVGLWCAHPDFRRRPSMRQVVSALNFETPPPNLPAQMPVPTYGAPAGLDLANSTWPQSSSTTSVTGFPSAAASSSSTTGASTVSMASGSSASSTSPLLLSM